MINKDDIPKDGYVVLIAKKSGEFFKEVPFFILQEDLDKSDTPIEEYVPQMAKKALEIIKEDD